MRGLRDLGGGTGEPNSSCAEGAAVTAAALVLFAVLVGAAGAFDVLSVTVDGSPAPSGSRSVQIR